MLTSLGASALGAAFWNSDGGPLFGDTKLDSGASTTSGTVTAVTQRGDQVTRIAFQFQPPGGLLREGQSFGSGGYAPRVGQAHDVQYWAEDPRINRLTGTDALYLPGSLSLLSNTLLLAGLICSTLWLRSAIRLRLALRDGPYVEAQVVEARPVRFLNARQVAIQYRFHDNEGREVIQAHWLPHRCELAQRLLAEQPRTIPVVYDPANPGLSRAVSAEDFLTEGATPRRSE